MVSSGLWSTYMTRCVIGAKIDCSPKVKWTISNIKWKLSELFEETNYNQEAKYLIQPKIQVNYLIDVFHEWCEIGYIHIEFVSALYIYKWCCTCPYMHHRSNTGQLSRTRAKKRNRPWITYFTIIHKCKNICNQELGDQF